MKGILLCITLISVSNILGPVTAENKCQPNGFKECKSNSDCCSDSCDKEREDDLGTCVPGCGRPFSNLAHQPVKRSTARYGEQPWFAGIYEFKEDKGIYEHICGGTLISPRVVIAAAHCFALENRKDDSVDVKKPSLIKVALGKYFRSLNQFEDALAQIVDVENIELPQEYKGRTKNYKANIAFVTLKTKVEYSRAVQPICIDVGADNFEDQQLVEGAVGKIVGWGLTPEKKPSETLKLAEMPFIPRDECKITMNKALFAYATDEKFCAGGRLSNGTVCAGDSGGGLVFEEKDTKAYYLRGIAVLGERSCRGSEIVLFTKLSSYKDLVEKYLKVE